MCVGLCVCVLRWLVGGWVGEGHTHTHTLGGSTGLSGGLTTLDGGLRGLGEHSVWLAGSVLEVNWRSRWSRGH